MKIRLVGFWWTKDVLLNGKRLSPEKSQKIINHSPDGFNWGYFGSGPAQLSLAILLELTSKEIALKNYNQFKLNVISKLHQADFDVEIDVSEYLT